MAVQYPVHRRNRNTRLTLTAAGAALLCVLMDVSFAEPDGAWLRHTIDNSSTGADGVRTADINQDGLLDLTTGWEEGGVVRVYVNPGPKLAKDPWPKVSAGRVAAPEDAVFVDLDGDGALDVVSSTEGGSRTLFVHWAPPPGEPYLRAEGWKTQPFEVTQGRQQWMFALPLDVDGKNGIDLVVGAKNAGAQIGWLESPADPRDTSAWRWHPLYEAGWIMSLLARDMDGDGDLDILASDRKGTRRGCLWLENPGPQAALEANWKEHRIASVNEREVMFLDMADIDRDGLADVIAAVRGGPLLLHRRLDDKSRQWETFAIELPEGVGTGKAVVAADVNLDGSVDLIFSCENAAGGKAGLGWLSSKAGAAAGDWEFHPISGPAGVKFDRIELLDLDHDGDLDVVTCEETDNLGVVWYENPTR